MFYSRILFILFFLPVSVFAQGDLIAPSLTGSELIDYLQANYSVTDPQGYSKARDAMYGSIDNKDGQVTGVYTGYTITTDNRTDAFNQGINTEHTWPQGMFGSSEPMRGDIHHLFPTVVEVNGARASLPFDEIPDNQTDEWFYLLNEQSSIPSSNIDLYSEVDYNNSFEPREDHKGNVARAIFYFWTIYQDRSDVADDASFFNGMKDVLLDWHDADPVDKTEIDRSIGIEAVQGNRNPFIHDSTLVRRAYFGGMPVSVEEDQSKEIIGFSLHQNYPNPFNPNTIISFEINTAGNVKLEVFNLLGQSVAVLVDTHYSAGIHKISFDARSLSGGIYVYRLTYGEQVLTKKMTLIK